MVALQAKRIKAKPITKNKINRTGFITTPVAIKSPQFNQLRTSITSESANKKLELLVVVASTGGPVAIQKVLIQLSGQCLFPILIVQHMPHNFTKSFAERLNQLCEINVKEAANGDPLKPGEALLAPGGMQMEVTLKSGKKVVKITEKQRDEIYSPCADVTLASVSNVYSADVLTVVLTGMGSDGQKGASSLKQKGLSVWAQNEASCTIYGMPKAIVDANLADKVYSLDEIANEFNKLR
ncbi:MAG TPA: chemotaxis protein CheB [Hydrogenothermaceae bacterium]|nr:chemotaxis protein CheB [Hydrogenothermaceae bacterium]